MSLYIYRRAASDGATALADALEAVRFRAKTLSIQDKVRRGDYVVAWGETVAPIAGVTILNGAPIRSKYSDAVTLREAGVPTVEVAQQRPADRATTTPAATDPVIARWDRIAELAAAFPQANPATVRSTVARDAINSISTAIRQYLDACNVVAPQPTTVRAPAGDWVGRTNDHVGGTDLLNPPARPDYWVKKEKLVKEYRVHSFLGKSIRAGIKGLREGYIEASTTNSRVVNNNASAWIRSWDGGWRILYDGISSKKRHRDLAHQAVAALGLQFGAVDIGEREDGSLIVLEVNRAPGLEGGTVDKYAEAIERWMSGATA